jgi:hypothetical protein
MWLILIPVGDGKEVVGAMIGVSVLDGCANRFGERDRRVEMEAIYGGTATGKFSAYHGRSE